MTQQKSTYRVDTPMRHNGEVYHPHKEGRDTIELTDKEAQTLLAMRAVSVHGAQTAADATSGEVTAPTVPAERIAAIKEAIGQLEPGNGAHWLKDGKTPEVKALEELLGWNIKAEERNQAFAELTKEGEE